MKRTIDPLVFSVAKIDSTENSSPLRVYGHQNLVGIHYQLCITSAQVKSCLSLAGLHAKRKTRIIGIGLFS